MKKWSNAANVRMASRLIVFVLMAMAGLSLLFRFRVFGSCHRMRKRKKAAGSKEAKVSCSCRKRCHYLYEEAAEWSVLGLTMQIIFLIVPPLVQFQIVEPCFDCYDFEGAAVHEIGHVLGLGHPNTAREEVDATMYATFGTRGDNVYNRRLSAGIRYTEPFCLNPWNDVHNNTPPNAETDPHGCNRGYDDTLISGCVGIRDSVMEAFTQNNPSVCLAPDDLDGIQTLYPDCELSVTTPVCYRVNLNLGFVRISVFVLVPLLIVFAFVVLMQAVIQYHNREELREHKLALKQKRKEVVAGKFRLGAAAFAQAGAQGAGGGQYPAAPASSGSLADRMKHAKHHDKHHDAAGPAGGAAPQPSLHAAAALANARAAAQQAGPQAEIRTDRC